MTITLETLALTKYGTMTAFAKAAERSPEQAKRLLDPATNLKTSEIDLLINMLEIPSYLITPLFFGTMYLGGTR